MGKENSFLKNNISAIYRKQILDVMIYTFIDTQRFTIPGISVTESAKSFLHHHNIDEGELSLNSIESTYYRLQKELYEEQKTCNKKN